MSRIRLHDAAMIAATSPHVIAHGLGESHETRRGRSVLIAAPARHGQMALPAVIAGAFRLLPQLYLLKYGSEKTTSALTNDKYDSI